MKRARVRLRLPVSYAMTSSGNSPLNALARLILSLTPSEPHTLGSAEHWPKRLPVGTVFEWRTWMYPTIDGLVIAFYKR